MPLLDKTNIDLVLQKYPLDKISELSGKSPELLQKVFRFCTLAAVHQVQFRLQQLHSRQVTYKTARVAAASGISKHLFEIYQKDSHHQGIINMTAILFNGNLPKVEQMIKDAYGLSDEEASASLVFCSSATLALLGNVILTKKIKADKFFQYLTEVLPVFTEALSTGLQFPFSHWEQLKVDLVNAQFKSEQRRARSSKKGGRSLFSLKLGFLFAVTALAAVYFILF